MKNQERLLPENLGKREFPRQWSDVAQKPSTVEDCCVCASGVARRQSKGGSNTILQWVAERLGSNRWLREHGHRGEGRECQLLEDVA